MVSDLYFIYPRLRLPGESKLAEGHVHQVLRSLTGTDSPPKLASSEGAVSRKKRDTGHAENSLLNPTCVPLFS